ncbi:reverse transcriptase domain-containing protein, partial [Klebsiella pneumoniae]
MDDILIYSNSLEEHRLLLEQVLQILHDNKFLLKLPKCEFARKELEYLGHTIFSVGVATEPSKVQAVVNWPTPETL